MAVIEERPESIAEQSVIGCILLDETAIHIAREIVKPEDFYSRINQKIYSEMISLSDNGQPINIATVLNHLVFDEEFSKNNGIDILTNSTAQCTSAAFVETYAGQVKSESVRRQLSFFADMVKDITNKPIRDIGSVISSLNDKLYELNETTANTPWVSFADAVQNTCKDIIDKSKKPVIKSGFVDIDEMIAGFAESTLTIIAARPAMGKTALGLNILTNAAIKTGTPAAFFSLEMTHKELIRRVISNMTDISGDALKKRLLTDEEWNRIVQFAQDYRNSQIFIDETPGVDISVLRDRAKRMQKQYGIKMLIIDYLQLMRSDKKRIQSPEQEVADISKGLKGVAKELNIPVIALAQLNRATESRTEKRPVLSDLRGSGSIEQDADTVMFIHRDDYYKSPGEQKDNEAEIIIAKQRSGPTGVVKLHWDGQYTRFSNLEDRF